MPDPAPAVGPGEIAALVTSVLWAGTALLFGAAARRIGADRVNRIRLAMACGFLGAMVLFTGAAAPLPAAQMLLLFASGVVGLALGDAAYFRSLEILGARRGSLLMSVAPVFTAILMVPLLGEGIGVVGIAGMALTLGGVAWVQAERAAGKEVAGSVARGVMFGVLGALGQAGGYILAKVGLGAAPAEGDLVRWVGLEARQEGTAVLAGEHVIPLFGTLLRMVAALAWVTVAAMLDRKRSRVREVMADRPALWLTLGGTVCGPFLGVWLSLVAVSLANTAVAATILAASPVFVIPLVRAVHGEKASPRAWIGALVAIGGLAVLSFRAYILAALGG